MPGVDFEEAPAVRDVAVDLMKHHPHLVDAKDLIGFYFRYGSSDWAGKAKKCTAFERHMTGKQLFVFVNAEAWEALKYDQRAALVDHELCHFSRKSERHYDDEQQRWVDAWAPADDADSWGIREHDVEEFSDVIKRHGLWEQGIEQFAQAVRHASYQADLFEDYPAKSVG